MKLSVDEAKLTGLWARNCVTIQVFNLPSDPESYRAFRETGPSPCENSLPLYENMLLMEGFLVEQRCLGIVFIRHLCG